MEQTLAGGGVPRAAEPVGRFRRLLTALGPLAFASFAAVACAPPAPGPLPAGVDADVADLARLVDAHRSSAGCRPLSWHGGAARIAQAHAADMLRHGYVGHTDSGGSTLTDRLAAAGIRWRAAGENVARNDFEPEHVLALWLDSPRHRANLDNCRFTAHGIGRAGDRWVHVFLTPLEST